MLKWFIYAVLGAAFILAVIPAWHGIMIGLTKDLDPFTKLICLFLFDPTEYAFKWIIGLIIACVAIFKG